MYTESGATIAKGEDGNPCTCSYCRDIIALNPNGRLFENYEEYKAWKDQTEIPVFNPDAKLSVYSIYNSIYAPVFSEDVQQKINQLLNSRYDNSVEVKPKKKSKKTIYNEFTKEIILSFKEI